MEGCKKCEHGLVTFACKCGKRVCLKHRAPETHACDFDFRAQHQKELVDKNPVVVASKVRAI